MVIMLGGLDPLPSNPRKAEIKCQLDNHQLTLDHIQIDLCFHSLYTMMCFGA